MDQQRQFWPVRPIFHKLGTASTIHTKTLEQLPLLEAGTAWLESRKPYIAESTYEEYLRHVKTFAKFFGDMRLTEIGHDEIRAYQQMRLGHAGGSAINKECSVLQQMLKRIGRWEEIQSNYQPLPLPKESSHRALSAQEIDKLCRAGASNPNWDVALCTFILSINTSCGPGELSHLRRMDVNWENLTFRVQPEGAKNEHRIRIIPLNATAERAMKYLWERGERLGSKQDHHYILPFRIKKNKYDPERPTGRWRYAWREMCARAGIRAMPYDGRHTFITDLLSNPDVSEESCKALAGHVSERMLKRYSHQKIEVKRAAVEALEWVRTGAPPSPPAAVKYQPKPVIQLVAGQQWRLSR